MAPPSLAAFDPVFYLLHSYVDLLWEIFRGLQKRKGIDPTTDYPLNNTEIPPGQRYNDSSGFGALLNRHGLSNVFTDNIYKYERPPTCTRERPDCGSEFIHCDVNGPEPRCVSASIFDPRPLFLPSGLPMNGGSGIRHTRSVRNASRADRSWKNLLDHATEVKCQASNVNEQYGNTFTIDGKSDKSLWAYIPVQVIYTDRQDSGNASTPVHEICKRSNDGSLPVRVFVESNGLNYDGMYKHISHFRKNVGTDAELAYVGVRKPTNDVTSDVVLSAYDNCGRVCQPYCLDASGKSRKCPGAIRLSKHAPLMYWPDAGAATGALWVKNDYGLPVLAESQVFVRFVCDASVSFWPW